MSLVILGTADGVDSSAQHDQHEKNLSDPWRVAKLTVFFLHGWETATMKIYGHQRKWKNHGTTCG